MFVNKGYDKHGKNVICQEKNAEEGMLMDITVYKMKKGESMNISSDKKEMAILLVKGQIVYDYNDVKVTAKRQDFFKDGPYCLHVPKETKVLLFAEIESEVLIQAAENDTVFDIKMYTPSDVTSFVSCKDKWENVAVRDVVTIFDYDNAPYSKMVIGEVYARQGRWWSYIPHSHPQPEVYYYRFVREEGFGACFIDEEAYTIKDGAAGLFKGGQTHVQVTAPGYPMYCCWMIKHLENDPWKKTRTDDPRYSWLLEI